MEYLVQPTNIGISTYAIEGPPEGGGCSSNCNGFVPIEVCYMEFCIKIGK